MAVTKKLWEEILMHASKMLLSVWFMNKSYTVLTTVQFTKPFLCVISTSSDSGLLNLSALTAAKSVIARI